MYGPVQERVLLNNLKDPVLLSAFAMPTKGGSTAASTLSYLAQQWNAEPVAEFRAEQLYDYSRIRPQLQTSEDGERSLQWPTNTVYLARPDGVERSFLLLIGVEPNFGWQGLIESIEAFCRRAGVTTAITLHSAPAGVSHRKPTPVTAVYGSPDLQASMGLPPTAYHDGPLNFGAVLSLHLNATGCKTADLIALEPFYTPGLPDAQAARSLIDALDRYLGVRTPVDSLVETADRQRELYDNIAQSSEHLASLAEDLDRDCQPLLGETNADLSVKEVMDEVDDILSSFQ